MLMPARTRRSRLFPYTTLFRSGNTPIRHLFSDRSNFRDACKCKYSIFHRCPYSCCCSFYQYRFNDGKCAFPKTNERSEEHTSELQSRGHLVCRLLLEKKKYEDRPLVNK